MAGYPLAYLAATEPESDSVMAAPLLCMLMCMKLCNLHINCSVLMSVI